jgi:hypothetical protein
VELLGFPVLGVVPFLAVRHRPRRFRFLPWQEKHHAA